MLIVAGGTRADHFFTQAWIERFAMQVGEFREEGFRLGAGGENAPDRRQGEGAEANGSLQGLAYVVALILGDQGQELLSLQFALDLFGEQAIEEHYSNRAEFAEALTQEQRAAGGIVHRMVALERLPHAGLRTGHERMAGNLLQADRVDDDFPLGDAYGQDLADVRPRHRVQVEPMRDVAFDVDVALDDQ